MIKRCVLAVAALFCGGAIYLCSRSETLLMFVWCERLGLSQLLKDLRQEFSGSIAFRQDWVRFSLPNALWLFAGLLIIDAIWGRGFANEKMLWLISFWGIAMGSEFAQALHLVPGTFDWQDVALMMVGTLLSVAAVYEGKTEGTVSRCL